MSKKNYKYRFKTLPYFIKFLVFLLVAVLTIILAFELRSFLERQITKMFLIKLSEIDIKISDFVNKKEKFFSNEITDEELKEQKEVNVLESKGGIKDNLVLASFCDIFSGGGYINSSLTDFYLDFSGRFIFPPKFSYKLADENDFLKGIKSRNFYFKDDTQSAQNFEILKSLGLNGEVYSLTRYSKEDLDLLGAVLKEGDGYKIYAFKKEGENWVDVLKDKKGFSSKLKGEISFGGESDNFLIFYGAEKGVAFNVLKKDNDFVTYDISGIFDYRVSRGGFKAEILFVKRGVNNNFYLLGSNGAEVFLKVFSDSTGKLIGLVDYTPYLEKDFSNFTGIGIDKKENTIYLSLKNSSGDFYVAFDDYGFDKSKKFTVVSSNISPFGFIVHSANFYEINFYGDDKVDFYLSNDGRDWKKASLNETVEFNNLMTGLFWKAEITPLSKDIWSSSNLRMICMYFYRKIN